MGGSFRRRADARGRRKRAEAPRSAQPGREPASWRFHLDPGGGVAGGVGPAGLERASAVCEGPECVEPTDSSS